MTTNFGIIKLTSFYEFMLEFINHFEVFNVLWRKKVHTFHRSCIGHVGRGKNVDGYFDYFHICPIKLYWSERPIINIYIN